MSFHLPRTSSLSGRRNPRPASWWPCASAGSWSAITIVSRSRAGSGSRSARAISTTSCSTLSRRFCDHHTHPGRSVGARHLDDQVGSAPPSHAQRRGGDARLRAPLRRGRGSLGGARPHPRLGLRVRADSRAASHARHRDAARERLAGGHPPDIASHADYLKVPRDTNARKALYAVDEMCGFIIACALVKPDKSLGAVEASTVRKKMQDKAFARGVHRDELVAGAALPGRPYHARTRRV